MDISQFSLSENIFGPLVNKSKSQPTKRKESGDGNTMEKSLAQGKPVQVEFLTTDSSSEAQTFTSLKQNQSEPQKGSHLQPRPSQPESQKSLQLPHQQQTSRQQVQNMSQLRGQANQFKQQQQRSQEQSRQKFTQQQQLKLQQTQLTPRPVGQQTPRPVVQQIHRPLEQQTQRPVVQQAQRPVEHESLKQPDQRQTTHSENARAEQKVEARRPYELPFPESFQDMTVHDLFSQCQNHLSVINSCTDLQLMVKEELKKQAKLDSIICHKLTAKANRLQQQAMFLEKVQAPSWVKAALDDLGTRVSQLAQLHQTFTNTVTEQCDSIQSYIDDHHELIKSMLALQEGKENQSVSANTENSEGATPTKPTGEEKPESGSGAISFLQASNTFEGIRKPWLKIISLLEYQQEQFDAALEQFREVDNEITSLSKTEDPENLAWRIQLQMKDLEIRREFLETRKDRLWKDLSSAKKDLSDFEFKHKDSVMRVVNVLRDHRARYDSNLRQSFQLLKAASLQDTAITKILPKQDSCVSTEDSSFGGSIPATRRIRDPWGSSVLEKSSVFSEKTSPASTIKLAADFMPTTAYDDPVMASLFDVTTGPTARMRRLLENQSVFKEPIYSTLLNKESELKYLDKSEISCVYPSRTTYRQTPVRAFDTLNLKPHHDINFSQTSQVSLLKPDNISLSDITVAVGDLYNQATNVEASAPDEKNFKSVNWVSTSDEKETALMNKFGGDMNTFDSKYRNYKDDLAMDGIYQTCNVKTMTALGKLRGESRNQNSYLFLSRSHSEKPDIVKEKRVAHLIEKYTSRSPGSRVSLLMPWKRTRAWDSATKDLNSLNTKLDISSAVDPQTKSRDIQAVVGCVAASVLHLQSDEHVVDTMTRKTF